jgi:hypothetical protein
VPETNARFDEPTPVIRRADSMAHFGAVADPCLPYGDVMASTELHRNSTPIKALLALLPRRRRPRPAFGSRPATFGASGGCSKHGVYRGRVCPGCAAASSPSKTKRRRA